MAYHPVTFDAAGTALLQAKEVGLSVISKEAMANGRLTPRNTDPAIMPKLKLLCDTAQQVRSQALALTVAGCIHCMAHCIKKVDCN